jgi:hypothetical protein
VSFGKNGWVFRFDRPHSGADFNHLNINPKFTGVADPHIPLPGGAVPVGEAATKAINVAGKVVLVAAVAVDTYRHEVFSVAMRCDNFRRRENNYICDKLKTRENRVQAACLFAFAAFSLHDCWKFQLSGWLISGES